MANGWLFVDTTWGLMDGFYADGVYPIDTKESPNEFCHSLNKRYPGANFLATRVEGSYGAGISDFCLHTERLHIDRKVFEEAMQMRKARKPSDSVASAEDALLGSILLNPKVLSDLEELYAFQFLDVLNRLIYTSILLLVAKENNYKLSIEQLHIILDPFDLYRLAGGKKKLIELAACVPNAAHAKHYFNIVVQKHLSEAEQHVHDSEDLTAARVEWMLYGDDGFCDWLFRIEEKSGLIINNGKCGSESNETN